jgi:hypothetical protein
MGPDNYIQIMTDRLIIRPVQPEYADAIASTPNPDWFREPGRIRN